MRITAFIDLSGSHVEREREEEGPRRTDSDVAERDTRRIRLAREVRCVDELAVVPMGIEKIEDVEAEVDLLQPHSGRSVDEKHVLTGVAEGQRAPDETFQAGP